MYKATAIKWFTTLSILGVLATPVLAANDDCPMLTADEVRMTIDNGAMHSDPSHTLAVEAGKTPEEVIKDEPTANPYDTYYAMTSKKEVNNSMYMIYVGNILGKDATEARERAKKIMLGSEKTFMGMMDPDVHVCVYKVIDASPAIPSYPFKSHYETAILFAIENANIPNTIANTVRMKFKK